jgi:thioredoxin reductase (NADPH)
VPALAGSEAFVLGGANSAGQAALYLAEHARRVTMIVRAASLGAAMSDYLVRQIEATPNVEVRLATEVVGGGGDDWLDHLVLRRRDDGAEETVHADALFVMIGARPNTEWLPAEVARSRGGFVLTGADAAADPAWPLARSPFGLETTLPGVFAAGDVRHGSLGRVAAAVGEGSTAIKFVHELVALERQLEADPA